MVKEYNDLFNSFDKKSAFQSIFSMLWYSTLPCFDVKDVTSAGGIDRAVLKYCEWKVSQLVL